MADADVDGGHITTLLLTFFYRLMPKLVDGGHVFLAQPPLYQLRKGTKTAYAMNDAERDRLLARDLKDAGERRPDRTPGGRRQVGGGRPDGTPGGRGHVEVSRFKGLGEMDPQQLWDTTMDPARRTLLRVTVQHASAAYGVFSLLMGESAADRRDWIEANAQYADNVDV
jgi:DNA gyrase subunit B